MTTVGKGQFTYELIENWAKPPQGWTFDVVTSIAVDSNDNVYAFQRKDPPIVVFDSDGNFISSWGNGTIDFAHGIDIGPDGFIYLTDRDHHVVLKYTLDGKPLMILGTRYQHSDTGTTEEGGKVLQPGGPFNRPAGAYPGPSGDIYVADGYCNCRVHRFSAKGELISSWGEPGTTAPNEFQVPHCVKTDREGTVYVCDRDNSRLQIFSATGEFKTMWTDLERPTAIFLDANETIYITELASRVSIWDKQGNLLQRVDAPSAHWIYGDSKGNLYVSGASAKGVTKLAKRG